MIRYFTLTLAFFSLALATVTINAQQPTGTISGQVVDQTGAALSGTPIRVINIETGFTRSLVAGTSGSFSASSLEAGRYRVEADAKGFKKMVREADVAAGVDTSVDLRLEVGSGSETVTVSSATDQIDHESHAVTGTIEREEIESLPLNGRNFLQLAALQPGVAVATTSTSIHNQQFAVSIMGGNSQFTRVTVDGINIGDEVDGGTMQNFSQEVVQEFQIATANFDISAGASASGAINIVTRTGGNQFHGGGYFFYRDNKMAAYPGLTYNPQDPDPFFARRQSGGTFSGPILKDRLFFFFNIEHNNQTSVTDIQPTDPALSPFGVIYPSPYDTTQLSNRIDYRINDRNTLFQRYSHDGNHGFGVRGNDYGLPSNWTQNTNWADQYVAGLTTTLKSNLVNDSHWAYTYWNTNNMPAGSDCATCIGVGGPEINVEDSSFTIGNQADAPQGVMERHYIWNDNLTWQKSAHQFRFGGEVDHQHTGGHYDFDNPGQLYLYSPEQVEAYNAAVPAAKQIPLPASFNTLSDILQLPLQSFNIGVGNPALPAPFDAGDATNNTHFNAYALDTWKVTRQLIVNVGLGWTYDNNLLNFDLSKPAFLQPIVGTSGLGYPQEFRKNFSPTLGFVWSPDHNRKMVIRGGVGLYYDTALLSNKLEERSYLGPIGNGRYTIPGSVVPNPLPGIPGVPEGTALQFAAVPTQFTGADLEKILTPIGTELAQVLASYGSPTSLTYRGINVFKSAGYLYPNNFRPPESQHFNVGVQRELSQNWVASADFVWKHSLYGSMGDVDLNHYNSAAGPVIPKCTSAAEVASMSAECSEGAISFLLPDARSRYAAVMLGIDKRMSKNLQMRANYTFQDAVGFNGVYNLNNLFSSWGEQLPRNVFNLSAIYRLPWGIQTSLVNTIQSVAPFTAYIGGIDLSGTGVENSLLPGASYGAFGVTKGKADLAQLVNTFNLTYAGTKTPLKQVIPTLTLPNSYSFGTPLIDEDVRLSKTFSFRERYGLNLIAECFNCLNISNLTGYSGNLTEPASFGQATGRIFQVFGSGGPRALQLATRFSF